MGVVKMNRLTLVGLLNEKDAVVNTLSKLGAIDIRDNQEQSDVWNAKISVDRLAIQKMQEQKQLLESTIQVSKDLLPYKQPMFTIKRSISMTAFMAYNEPAYREEILGWAEKLKLNRQNYSELANKLATYKLQSEVLAPWQEALGDAEPDDTRRIHQWLGRVANMVQFTKLQTTLAEAECIAAAEPILNKDPKQTVYVLVVAPASAGEQALLLAQQYGFQPLQQKSGKLTPQEEYNKCLEKIANLNLEMDKLQNEARDLAHHISAYEELSDYLNVQIEKKEADGKIKSSDRLFVIQGYVPAHMVKGITKGMEETYCVSLDVTEVDKSEDYPILLHNNALTSPYEAVIDMFSLPNAAEVDPTSAVAPFYCIFFGMMFSDVAYGLIFCLITAFLVYKVKVEGGLRKMCQMFFQCGLSSIIWGILFGGFFGNLIDAFTDKAVMFKAVWFNPMDDPTKMMVWSVIFGTIHIFVGMSVKIKILLATGKVKEAIFDVCPWYLIISGLGVMGYGAASNVAMAKTVGSYLAIAGAIIVLLFAGRSVKNPILRIIKGLGSLYDITGYFSDIMSYTRILALCLSTSVIAMVVNLLALLPGKNIIGLLFFVVIAILGHTLNFALSALSAYVHTTRLHYVEFFSKFYEGGGRAYQPLAYRTKYIQIDSKNDEPQPVKESLKTRFARFI